jgi:hypothetical protein
MAYMQDVAGVFLISMDGNDDALDPAAAVIRSTWPKMRVGVNYLTEHPIVGINRAFDAKYDAFWIDTQMFTRGELGPIARGLQASLCGRFRNFPMFAAVAFKGQPPDPFPGDSAGLAAHYGLIPTTSGPATGQAPDVEKVRRIRAGIDGTWGRARWPLAIASGVTPENARSFVDAGATHLLVATGISKSFHEFDPAKLEALMKAVC